MNFLTLTLFISLLSLSAFSLPAYNVDKVDTTPNICQSCFPDIVRWKGKPHCGPAAVSNSLVWLSEHGYSSLYPLHSKNKLADQAALVDQLGSVMGTTEKGGTSPRQILSGLKQYLSDKNVKFKRLAAVGWRGIPEGFDLDYQRASLDWIKEGTLAKNSVWILIGWAHYNPAKNEYQIYDGHWMTVVGYGKNRKGELDANILIVHDPAERAERKSYFATIKELSAGVIDETVSAKGVLTLNGDVVIKPGADVGLIQGAYRLEL